MVGKRVPDTNPEDTPKNPQEIPDFIEPSSARALLGARDDNLRITGRNLDPMLITGRNLDQRLPVVIGQNLDHRRAPSNTRNGFSDVTLVTRVAERGIHNSPTQLRTRSWTAVVYDGWLTDGCSHEDTNPHCTQCRLQLLRLML